MVLGIVLFIIGCVSVSAGLDADDVRGRGQPVLATIVRAGRDSRSVVRFHLHGAGHSAEVELRAPAGSVIAIHVDPVQPTRVWLRSDTPPGTSEHTHGVVLLTISLVILPIGAYGLFRRRRIRSADSSTARRSAWIYGGVVIGGAFLFTAGVIAFSTGINADDVRARSEVVQATVLRRASAGNVVRYQLQGGTYEVVMRGPAQAIGARIELKADPVEPKRVWLGSATPPGTSEHWLGIFLVFVGMVAIPAGCVLLWRDKRAINLRPGLRTGLLMIEGGQLFVGARASRFPPRFRLRFESAGLMLIDGRGRERLHRWEAYDPELQQGGSWSVVECDVYMRYGRIEYLGLQQIDSRGEETLSVIHRPSGSILTVRPLVQFIASQTVIQTRLADQKRLEQLLSDIARFQVAPAPPGRSWVPGSARRIHDAIVDELEGRPGWFEGRVMPGSPGLSAKQITEGVIRRIGEVDGVNRDEVEERVRRHLAVTPWPFGALLGLSPAISEAPAPGLTTGSALASVRVGVPPRDRPPFRRWLAMTPDELRVSRRWARARKFNPKTVFARSAIRQYEMDMGLRSGSVLVRGEAGSVLALLFVSSVKDLEATFEAAGLVGYTRADWPGRVIFPERNASPDWTVLA
jgi:hypothetical protein